uniref:Uncharacterized protein n=2 Tax=Aegilops tauschii subsp. strangulata TaxID=200361 RepID=A0A452Y5G8_AEGTS
SYNTSTDISCYIVAFNEIAMIDASELNFYVSIKIAICMFNLLTYDPNSLVCDSYFSSIYKKWASLIENPTWSR